MMSPDIIFTLLYILICACIIYPPTEFESAGLTIPKVFSNILGAEEERFVTYHIKKSLLTLLIYSLLPLAYLILLPLLGYYEEVNALFLGYTIFWKAFCTTSIVLPLLALYQIKVWYDNNYEKHPMSQNIAKFCNNNTNWQSVACDIDTEFRRIDKVSLQISPIIKTVVTENWLIKVTPFSMFLVHQSDASLVVKEATVFSISQQGANETQFLNIEVKTSRPNVEPFLIRINSLDFKDLQDRVNRTIAVLPNVKFHKTVIEQFIDVFKETIKNNPKYDTEFQNEQCIGCLQATASIKLQKICSEENRPNENHGFENCRTCYCRPMWCIDCMAKWFASRQDTDHRNQWLASKCTCPMCRATFCILDVCLLNNVNLEE